MSDVMCVSGSDTLLIKIESIANLLALLEDIFSMKQNTEAQLAISALKILISDLEKEIWNIENKSL